MAEGSMALSGAGRLASRQFGLDFLAVQFPAILARVEVLDRVSSRRITAPSPIAMTASTPPYCAWKWGGDGRCAPCGRDAPPAAVSTACGRSLSETLGRCLAQRGTRRAA